MFRIHRVYDDALLANPRLRNEIGTLLRRSFPGLTERDTRQLIDLVARPWTRGFRHYLFTAEKAGNLIGAAICSFHDQLQFMYLDYIAAHQVERRGGVGEALYQRIREHSIEAGALGLFLECRPDSRAAAPDEATHRINKARVRFYERFGARVVEGTRFEDERSDKTRWTLMYDSLDRKRPLSRTFAVSVIEVILREKNRATCPSSFRRRVRESVTRDPVVLRTPGHQSTEAYGKSAPRSSRSPANDERILLVKSDAHEIHHVRDKGYCEVPVRVREITRGLNQLDIFLPKAIKPFSEKHVTAVHDPQFYAYLKDMSRKLAPDQSVYADVFPLRTDARAPKNLWQRAGYYATDSFTPISRNAFLAARAAVNCTLTAAASLVEGRRLAYSLVRPPGHHAERKAFGGFCYLNSNAIAANYLSASGKVAILDVDFHHGNGQQDIFYDRGDVLTVSIHADPAVEYPYFSGFPDETGSGKGRDANLNLPLPLTADVPRYFATLDKALSRIRRFQPKYVVIALGFDTAKRDPTGTWSLVAKDFLTLGKHIGALNRPTLIVQEGGYRTRTLAANAKSFFSGLWEGARR
ncbi:MAG: histone deacetylase family protein [Bdellovibrionales bacterium]|nr:histone deacetylase family protein [Bdellovibrionales bacterium]